MAACESLNTVIVVTPCAWSASAVAMEFRSTTPTAPSSLSNTSIHPLPRSLRKTVPWSPFEHTAGAPTLLSSVRNLSVHHVKVQDPVWISLVLATSSAARFAVASSSRILVLTAGSSTGSGQHIVSALLRHVSSSAATVATGAPGVGLS